MNGVGKIEFQKRENPEKNRWNPILLDFVRSVQLSCWDSL